MLVAVIIVLAIIAALSESKWGKVALSFGVLSCGCLLLEWLLDEAIFFTIAKACAAIMIIVLVGLLIHTISSSECC